MSTETHKFAPAIDPKDREVIESSTGPLSVTVFAQEFHTPTLHSLQSAKEGIEERRHAAELNMGGIKDALSAAKDIYPDARINRDLWLVNGISIDAPRAVLNDLMERRDVRSIMVNRKSKVTASNEK